MLKIFKILKFTLSIYLITTIVNASTLNLSISTSPNNLNPILSANSANSEITNWLYNGLFKYDKDANIVPDLASSFHFETKTRLIINLKKNIKWSDGVKFTADDVIFTYNKINDKNIYTPLAPYFKDIKSVKKINDYKIEIIYKKPYFKALVMLMTEIIPKHILKNEKNFMTSSFNRNPIGTGPYILKNLKDSSDITLYANDNYFEGRPKIDKIHYKFIPDSSTSFLFLKQEKLDIASLTPLQENRQLTKAFKKNYNIFERPAFTYAYLGFNLRNKKFKNPKIREALSLAINRQELIDILFFGHGSIPSGPFYTNDNMKNTNAKAPKVDLKKAKQILKELGFNKDNPFTFELTTNTGNDTRINAAQIIQYQLARIGVKMKIHVMEWQAFLNTVVTPRKFETVLLGWSMPLMPDAYPLWHSKSDKIGGFNFVGYHNKEVDKLIEKGSSTVDMKKLARIYQKISKLIVKDNPYIFLYTPNSITAVSKKIKHVKPEFLGIFYNQIEWEK